MQRSAPAALDHLAPDGQAFFHQVVSLRLLPSQAAQRFLAEHAGRLPSGANAPVVGRVLADAGLLTPFQLQRLLTGQTHGLVLGNYRILDRLGEGGMGAVLLGEHLLMKRRVAIKAMPVDDDCPLELRERFYGEMRVLADLHHPHIVTAYDAGELPSPGPSHPGVIYLVLELVSGGDLEECVLNQGSLPVGQACDWIRQAALGLQEAHDRHLIHRDIKPSNLLRTEQGQVKLVDFGLVRQFASQITDRRSLVGSIDFMAPEQSYDPANVTAAADVYGLGATLFWLLTGEPPYPIVATLGAALRALQQDPPRRLRDLRPDAPAELDVLINRMLARDPGQRPSMPLAVLNALTPFAFTPDRPVPDGVRLVVRAARSAFHDPLPEVSKLSPDAERPKVLIVDDEPLIRRYIRAVVETQGCDCLEAADGETALNLARQERCDLILLDLNLPGTDGHTVCRRLREYPPRQHLKIIIVSGAGNQDQLAEVLLGSSAGGAADDYITKPFASQQLEAKVRHALDLQAAQDRVDLLARHLLIANHQLEQSLAARAADVRKAQDALLFAMARMAESRDGETPGHLQRLQQYTRRLAEEAAHKTPWFGLVDVHFLEQLERCVPLHDIGKIGLPDTVLLKPGRLTAEERVLVETHPLIGDRMLEALAREHGDSLQFLGLARAIVRHHHERHDGAGYPDRLSGEDIPAAARLLAVADVYDALRRQRPHKPALSHAHAVQLILQESPGQFDPVLLHAFAVCHMDFDRIYRDCGEE